MYRFFILLFGVIVLVHTEDRRRCFDVLNFAAYCCQFNMTEENEAAMNECLRHNYDPHSCDFEKCYGEKKGFILSNGTLDKTLLENSVKEDYENYTTILEIVKEKCLSDDLSLFIPMGACYLRRLGKCLQIHTALNCPQWDDSDQCSSIQEEMKECVHIFSN